MVTSMAEDDLRYFIADPRVMYCTDGELHGKHPRGAGSFPRILGKYVRDEHTIPLEDAIRKMTSAVATRLSIHDRGLLKPGMYADVVVFDPATIGDRATYEQPKQLSVGVRDVWVNGVQVLRDGKHTGATPGRALRGPGYRPLLDR
jgi:N-acyl-D-aspartate/D-glutamate deacylase